MSNPIMTYCATKCESMFLFSINLRPKKDLLGESCTGQCSEQDKTTYEAKQEELAHQVEEIFGDLSSARRECK